MSDFRHSILRRAFALEPFSIQGDAKIDINYSLAISCIIPTYDRWRELENILSCLCAQKFPKDFFEVIVVEDGATEEGRACCQGYKDLVDITLIQSVESNHSVGVLRNRAIEASRGKYLLFLDDDTLIHQNDFLQILFDRFESMPEVGCLQIAGCADRCLLENRYSYLDQYSFATRCVAYRRENLATIGGFLDNLKSYEDIEMSIRFIISGGSFYQTADLCYYHPPLYFSSSAKTITNGLSFLTLYFRYGFILWLLCYLNACRFLPLLFSPSIRHRQWGKISAGFVIAPFYRLFKGNDIFYR